VDSNKPSKEKNEAMEVDPVSGCVLWCSIIDQVDENIWKNGLKNFRRICLRDLSFCVATNDLLIWISTAFLSALRWTRTVARKSSVGGL